MAASVNVFFSLSHSEVSVPALQESDVILYVCQANSGICLC